VRPNVETRAGRSPALCGARANYGSNAFRSEKYFATFGPIALIDTTQPTVMMPMSNPYSIRSWPCSSRTNETMKFFIIYCSPSQRVFN
jgi:hypothetical protein